MILLRLVSFMIVTLILMGAPFFLLPDAPQRPSATWDVIAGCAIIALLASGFFLVGIAGNRMKRSLRARVLAAVLLGFPILGCIAVLMRDETPVEVWMVGPLLLCAILLFMGFVYPGRRGPKHRRLRPRDPAAVKA
jgi:O-antigen/teichoic acid export membrane protein